MLHRIKTIGNNYGQGIFVGGCLLSSTLTLGYILDDSAKIEKNRIQREYEAKITELNKTIEQLRKELNMCN